ncbi:MAG: site-specific DNA-methyltransferase [Lacunisphaera sp.]|nr:site-specific DNA-methyltransferase [Lacunisphaera sp.]
MPKKPAKSKPAGAVAPNRPKRPARPAKVVYPDYDATFRPADAVVAEGPDVLQPSRLAYRDDTRGLYLYHGDCLAVMDTLLAKHPGGVFDLIFADPPYFLSNGGITCHAGRMVKVDKGDWDKSRGPEENHNFNTEWLRRCQALLKPNGTLWVSGTHHVIFSVGYAMQQLGMKMLNQVTWQKPNPPPNLACRYFTHSTETILWAAKNEQSKHRFNYADMKRANGNKQMKDVWTFTAPKPEEKILGKHPTQKPVALLERIILSSTSPGDFVLDPFMGSGTTALAALKSGRRFVGLDADLKWVQLAERRLKNTPTQEAFINTGGGARCADYPVRGLEIVAPIHWAGSPSAGRAVPATRVREWQQEQRLGRFGSGKMHQHRSELQISTQWSRLGAENHFACAA